METPQRNKLSMYLAVLNVLEKFKASWQALPGIAGQVRRLTELAEGIGKDGGLQASVRAGVAGGKNRRQMKMIGLAAEVAGDLCAFAQAQKDDRLAAQTDLEVTDLVRLADALVGPRCREIHGLGVQHAAAITDYGTTKEDLDLLDQAIVAYGNVATAPRQATVERAGATGDIGAAFEAGDALLREGLDKAMRKFKRRQPDFAQEYANARIIVDLGGGRGGKDDDGGGAPPDNGGGTPPAGPGKPA